MTDGIICYCGQVVATYHQECIALHESGPKGDLCGETKCAAYRDELECKIHKLEAALKKAETDGNAWYGLLQSERDQHHELIENLKSNIAYPWCPECKVECHATDEDHCCSSCGVDVVWPTAQHVENLGKVIDVLKKLKAVAPTTCEVEAVLEDVDAVLREVERPE
jgi:hypothetical protein